METIREEIEGISETKEIEVSEPQKMKMDLGFLTTKTGEGTVEEYLEHPLNFNNSKGLARVLRGSTGLFGALDLAIIDILVGILQFAKEKKGENKIDNN